MRQRHASAGSLPRKSAVAPWDSALAKQGHRYIRLSRNERPEHLRRDGLNQNAASQQKQKTKNGMTAAHEKYFRGKVKSATSTMQGVAVGTVPGHLVPLPHGRGSVKPARRHKKTREATQTTARRHKQPRGNKNPQCGQAASRNKLYSARLKPAFSASSESSRRSRRADSRAISAPA